MDFRTKFLPITSSALSFCYEKKSILSLMKRFAQKKQVMYVCPFCKKNVPASKKTEVHYRSYWINGCFDCFALSINETTNSEFQQKIYESL